MEDKKEEGLTTKKKGVFIPLDKRKPHSPKNIHLKKKEFIEQEEARKLRKMKLAEIEQEMKAQDEQKAEVKKSEEKQAKAESCKRVRKDIKKPAVVE